MSRGGRGQDLRSAARWGFWSGFATLTVYYTIVLIVRRGVRPPGLWLETFGAFATGALGSAWLFLHLRRLERDAERDARSATS